MADRHRRNGSGGDGPDPARIPDWQARGDRRLVGPCRGAAREPGRIARRPDGPVDRMEQGVTGDPARLDPGDGRAETPGRRQTVRGGRSGRPRRADGRRGSSIAVIRVVPGMGSGAPCARIASRSRSRGTVGVSEGAWGTCGARPHEGPLQGRWPGGRNGVRSEAGPPQSAACEPAGTCPSSQSPQLASTCPPESSTAHSAKAAGRAPPSNRDGEGTREDMAMSDVEKGMIT